MHEYSIITSIIEESLEAAERALSDEMKGKDATAPIKIGVIYVDVGERSGVDARLLASAFDTFKEATSSMEDTTLVINEVPITLLCHACNKEGVARERNYTACPNCGSKDVSITAGEEIYLKRLEFMT